jgi:hypothetical protein
MAKRNREKVYGEFEYILPVQPPKTQILNYDLPKKKQKWERIPLPDDFDNWELAKQEEYVEKEFDKIDNGVWLMINGNPYYLTGKHYFFLQWWVLEDGTYPDFRDADRRLFYMWDIAENDEKALGLLYMKFRRRGSSSVASSICGYIGISEKFQKLGIVSKTGDDARMIFSQMVVNGVFNLPEFLKPTFAGADKPVKEFVFGDPAKRTTKIAKDAVKKVTQGLNTIISWKNTALNSYDGQRMRYMFIDECFGKGTKILMDDMQFKNIEEIKVGDCVIVEGSKKMRVVKTCNGIDELFLVKQKYNKDYIVNSKHRLYLEYRPSSGYINTNGKRKDYNKLSIMTPVEYLSMSKSKQRLTYGLKSLGIDLDEKELPIDPYLLGLWLGDGYSSSVKFICNKQEDIEIYQYLYSYAKINNLKITEGKSNSLKCITLSLSNSNNRWNKNSILNIFKEQKLKGNKHIPLQYLQGSKAQRLELLAGIIDTDGYLANKNNSYSFEIGMSRQDLINDISKLSLSVGLKTRVAHNISNLKTDVYKVTIYGDLSIIPTKIKRKQVPLEYKRTYNAHINNIDIEPIGAGEYYGITLEADNDNDRRLILEDFTISMNCAKWSSEVPFDKYYEVVKTCLTKLGKKVGVAYITSTVGEVENDKTSSGNKKAGDSFKSVWEKSNPNKLYNGRTASGLIRYFSPAFDGYKMDEFGFSLIEESKAELEEIRRSYIENNDVQGLNEHIRQFPFTEEEALSSMSGYCLFDEERIRAQENFIKLQVKPLTNMYDLVWLEPFKSVKAIPNPNGRFEILRMPKKPNVFDIARGVSQKMKPVMQHEYIAGADPFSSSDFKDKRDASDGSLVLINKPDPNDPENSAMVDLLYLYRPKTVNELHEDYLKAVIFYSCELNTETTPATVVDWFIEKGFEHYLKETPQAVIPKSDRNKTISHTGKNKYGVSGQNKFAGNRMVELSQIFMDDYTEHINMPRLLEQCRKFDPNNRTAFDAFMAFGYALLAMGDVPKKKESKVVKDVLRSYKIDLTQ